MRRGIGIGVVLLLILAGIAIGVGAYNAGFSQGLEESGRAGDVVRVIGPGFGFFPFGLFLFPLFFIIAKSWSRPIVVRSPHAVSRAQAQRCGSRCRLGRTSGSGLSRHR
jgi:hypothetical protein